MDIARSISADAATANGLAGDILNDNQPYVYTLFFKIYRDLQDELISKGTETFRKFGHIYGVTPTQAANARTNVTITYQGYWNGQTLVPNIVLPADLIKPLEFWECVTGTQTFWSPMKPVSDAIASRPTRPRFGVWDFKNETLILPGSSQTNDLKVQYLCYAPDVTGPESLIYVVHAQSALANMMVAAVAKMLGGLEMAAVFQKDADKAIAAIVNRTATAEQYKAYNRRPFRRSRGRGRGHN